MEENWSIVLNAKEDFRMNQQSENPEMGLTVKDMVTTGIFTALYLVFTMVSGIFFAPNPVLT